ncbi:hypothetical protein BMH30_12145 [Leucobacter sp. OLES1]|nr:hypothetical protein BMH30_12145 [Leucobacter sp. OLES1]
MHGPYSDGVPVLSWCGIGADGRAFGRGVDHPFDGGARGRPGETLTARALASGLEAGPSRATGATAGCASTHPAPSSMVRSSGLR